MIAPIYDIPSKSGKNVIPRSAKDARSVCYRCGRVVMPKIVRQGGIAGAINMPVLGHSVIAPIHRDRYHLECPLCGAPFEDDETIRELNGEPSPETMNVVWSLVWVLLGIAGLALIMAMFSLPLK